MRCPQALDRPTVAEKIAEYVLPMTEHIDNNPTTLLTCVVPIRSLGGWPVTCKNPVTELAAYRENTPEKSAINHPFKLQQARQEKLILHNAMLHPSCACQTRQFQGSSGSSM